MTNADRMRQAAQSGPQKPAAAPPRPNTTPKAQKPAPQPKKAPRPKDEGVGAMRLPRLPDGAEFHAKWHATEEVPELRWHGVLSITVEGKDALAFACHSGSVRTLLFKLDTMYRDFLKKAEVPS